MSKDSDSEASTAAHEKGRQDDEGVRGDSICDDAIADAGDDAGWRLPSTGTAELVLAGEVSGVD
jgi:hypothetical protein